VSLSKINPRALYLKISLLIPDLNQPGVGKRHPNNQAEALPHNGAVVDLTRLRVDYGDCSEG
jgi:hypothetical protein